MKKALLSIAVLMIFATGASAQVPSSPFSFYVGGALSVPSSPDAFTETYNTGFHAFGGVGYSVLPAFQVIGKVEYNRFSFDFDNSGQTMLTDGGQQNVWLFGADGKYSFNLPASPVKPYAFGGLGMARLSTSDFEGTDLALTTAINDGLQSTSEFYWNIGAGAEFSLSPMVSLFAQARYINVATEGDALTWIPVSLGLKFF